MYGLLSPQLARTIQDERLRAARERSTRHPARGAAATHEATRARVLASLLLARRGDPSTHRRWAEQ